MRGETVGEMVERLKRENAELRAAAEKERPGQRIEGWWHVGLGGHDEFVRKAPCASCKPATLIIHAPEDVAT